MCLPTRSDQRSSPPAGSGTRSLLGMGGLMLVPAVAVAWRRRSARRSPTLDL